MQDGAGKAEQLALACREVVAPLPDFLVQAVVQLVDEVVRVDIAADLHDLLIRDVLLPQDNIGADGAREEENILQHLAEVLPQAGNFDLADVDAVNQNLTSLELIVAADEGENRALAGARGAHECHGLAGVHMERNALQHPLAGDIAEPDILEFDLALDVLQLDGVRGILHLGLNVHDGENFLRRRKGRLQPVELLCQVLDRRKELGDVHVERDDGAGRNALPQERGPRQVAHAAQIEQAENGTDIKHIHQRAEHAKNEDLLLGRPGQSLALLAELGHLLVFPAKDLGHFDAREVLGKIGIDVGRGIFHLAVSPAGELAEDDREDDDERHKTEHHQGQLIVEAEHRHQNAQNDERVLGQVDQQVCKHHRDGVGVVGHAGDQLAHRDLIELFVSQ